MQFSKITDYDIQAFVDGELDHERAKYVREQIRQNSKLKKRYSDLLSQQKHLKSWWEQIVN